MKLFSILLVSLFLFGCKSAPTERFPPVTYTLDIHTTEQGFFVVTRRGSSDSLAVRFNAEILRTDEPIIITP